MSMHFFSVTLEYIRIREQTTKVPVYESGNIQDIKALLVKVILDKKELPTISANLPTSPS